MIELEKIGGRCVECKRPMYWREDIGSVHYSCYKQCSNTQNTKEAKKNE